MELSRYGVLGLVGITMALAGCTMDSGDADAAHRISADQQQVADEWMVNTIRDAAINNAIITQHTLFPYHFSPGRDALNELGERDLAALAAYYRGHAGDLNIRRGDATDDLYKARVGAVRKRLTESGVDATRIAISDSMASGPGMASTEVVKILERAEKDSSTAAPSAPGTSIMDKPATGSVGGGQ